MLSPTLHLASVDLFKGLSPADLAVFEARLQATPVARGEELVREGEPADALYVVVSGRFAVEVAPQAEAVTEIARGATIGEIAFFTGGTRTATVRAIRDSLVLRLNRADFDELAARAPTIWRHIAASLAERLAAETRRGSELRSAAHTRRAGPRPRTLAIVAAGPAQLPPSLLSELTARVAAEPGTLVLTRDAAHALTGNGTATPDEATAALNALEAGYDTLLYLTDAELTPWSEKAIRQADEVLFVAVQPQPAPTAPVPLNPVERFALSLMPPDARRLVLVHPHKGSVCGTRHWLHARDPAMHHHVALSDGESLARLWRFLRGVAYGFVACGGGAFCAAHVGLYRAFHEAGTHFDYFGGASGGAAMAGAFAQDIPAGEIATRIERMFVSGKALARMTVPHFSLLDHHHFDAHLAREYGEVRIEDLWTPYFAVSADLANYEIEVHRSGTLWQAIRASAAIPGLLPPFYPGDGRMLVDGSVIANVPIETMHALKRGPNVVVSFDAPEAARCAVAYADLPARRELIWRLVTPFGARTLPDAPSAATVLVRSLMANRSHFERHLQATDWLLTPPTLTTMGALNWRHYREVIDMAYRYATAEISARRTGADTAKSAAQSPG